MTNGTRIYTTDLPLGRFHFNGNDYDPLTLTFKVYYTLKKVTLSSHEQCTIQKRKKYTCKYFIPVI